MPCSLGWPRKASWKKEVLGEVSREDLPGERVDLLLMKRMGVEIWSGTFLACPGLSTQHRVNTGMVAHGCNSSS